VSSEYKIEIIADNGGNDDGAKEEGAGKGIASFLRRKSEYVVKPNYVEPNKETVTDDVARYSQ
jgi:hypothetical protein